MTEEQFKVIVRAFFPDAVFIRNLDGSTDWRQPGYGWVGVYEPTYEYFNNLWSIYTTQKQMVTYIKQELA